MITTEQKKKLVSALRTNTLFSFIETSLPKLPLVIKNNNPDDNDYSIKNEKCFHYNNKWYSYKYSVDEPQYTFGILKVFNMPYRSFEGKLNKSSFICSLNSLIYQGYCEPFVLFINGEFVNWNYIDIVFDCDDTYIILHDEKYNWYNLTNAEIYMVILPFSIGYIGNESNSYFEMMYSITKSYIQESLNINSNGKITITIPGINEIYEYKGMVYNIGAWLYTQLKYNYFGLLSDDRVNKLKKIEIVKNEYDESGNIINSISTKFNAFDKDSYDRTLYNKICNFTKDIYIDKSLFRFNDNGELDNNGDNIIALLDDNIEFHKYNYTLSNIIHVESNIYAATFKENYIIFSNNKFIYNNDIDLKYNVLKIDNPDNDKYTIYVINNKLIKPPLAHVDNFSKIFMEYSMQDIFNSDNEDKINYLNRAIQFLDYDYKNSLLYDENFKSGMNEIINYNPLLLNSLYHTNIESTLITGKQANESMKLSLDYEKRNGLKIPRNKYNNHESYVLVFEDGELLEEYSNMIVYPNFLFIPMKREFSPSSQIELLYFNNINNNEIEFNITQNMIDNMPNKDSKWRSTDIFNQYIDTEELKIFNNYPKDIIVYKDLVKENQDIAFNISYRDDNNKLYLIKSVIDNALNKTDEANTFTAVSSRKFIYQRLYVDKKAYRISIDKRFKYCDNQKQYVLFINGRRMNDESFLVTIPKHTRPFWDMYLYVAKFVGPEDRIELFYLPDELVDINIDHNSNLEENGYIETDKTKLDVPYDPRLYLLFINGKKIAKDNIITIDTHTFRITRNTFTTNNLMINPINIDTLSETKKYLKDENKLSSYDDIIKFIKESDSLGYNELDNIFNTFVKISNIESNKTKQNVAKIAIINEIVRDFWVTSGYEYNELPFIYDFEMDDYIPIDKNNNAILPALDATQIINIIKNEIHLLYFYHSPEEDVYEIGTTLNGITFFWEYSQNLYNNITIYKQSMKYKFDKEYDETNVKIDANAREWKYSNNISKDITFTFTGSSISQTIQKITKIKFLNGIYYGNIDEDLLQFYKREYDWADGLMALAPNSGIIPSYSEQNEENPKNTLATYKDLNKVINNLEYNIDLKDVDLDNQNIAKIDLDIKSNTLDNTNLQTVFKLLNRSLQSSPEIILDNYVIGNNNYFVYACPKRLAYNNEEFLLEFILPDPHSEDIIKNCRDDKTTPIYTSGNWDIVHHNLLEPLKTMEMISLGEYKYTNSSGYAEVYCLWRSNGFFTRLFENYRFHIEVRYKDGSKAYGDGMKYIDGTLLE